MANRVIQGRKVTIGDMKITNGINDFTQPKYKKVMSSMEGSFIEKKTHTGFEAVEWSITIKGEMAKVAHNALIDGDETVIIYSENGKYKHKRYDAEHIMTGEVDFEYDASKMREQQTLTLTGQIEKHKHTEDGTLLTDVDIDNGKYLVMGKEYNV